MSKARDVSRLFSKTGSSSSDVGSSTVSSDTPPAGAGAGDKWFNTTNLTTYIYYDDGTSLQWVPATAPIPGPTGATGPAPSINFSAINQAMIPDTDVTHDLGSSTHKWKDLYLSGSTLYLGASATISAGTGSEIVLPSIKIGAGANAVKLSANASGGLETQAVVGGTTQAVKPAGGTVQVADLAAMQAIANPTIGDFVSVVSNKTIYMYNGTGFYKIAVMVNESPTAITGVDGSYQLATDGTATTITAISSDPEGRPLTWSYAVSSGALNGTTVAQTNNVFTITPHASNVAAFSLTFSVTDGINGAVNAVSTFGLSFSVTNSRYTALSVKATATGSNQTFDDASASNHTITVNGNVTASTFSPHRHGGYSIKNDESAGGYITIPKYLAPYDHNSPSTDTFTLETWAYQRSRAPNGFTGLFAKGYLYIGWGITSTGKLYLYNLSSVGGTTYEYVNETSNTVPLNTWTHLALAVSGGGVKMFIDGNLETLTSVNANPANVWGGYLAGGVDTQENILGGDVSSTNPHEFNGYVHNYRISDIARYSTNFTPAESFTSDSNTKLLIGRLPYLKDLSSNNSTLIPVGGSGPYPFNVTDNSPYSEADHGVSASLDGTNDYITIPQTTDTDLTGDFTVECWVYFNDTAGGSGLMGKWGGSGLFGWTLYATAADFWFYTGNSGSAATQGAFTFGAPAVNQWYHLAVSRTGSTISTYVNGTRTTTITDSNNCTANTTLTVGSDGSSLSSWSIDGYIADVRIVNGTGLYTGTSITVPTEPLTAVTNTKFLLNPQTSISDLSQSSEITCFGDAATSTTQVKFAGTKSIYLDGTGDYIQINNIEDSWISGYTGDFTIEFWWYPTNVSVYQAILTAAAAFQLYTNNSTLNLALSSTNSYSPFWHPQSMHTMVNNTWHHIAIVRNGNIYAVYVDGVSKATTTTSTLINTGTNVPQLGIYTGNSSPSQGYFQDFRITKGLARYTSTFTPPTAELEG